MPRNQTSHYTSLSFHGVRFISLLFNVIVGGLLAYFLVHLRSDGFKLPWTLLVVLGAALFSAIYDLLSWAINACASLAPLFSLFVNILLTIVWLVAFGLLTDNIYGTLGHSCSKSNWGTSRGVSVCNIYKLFYTFCVFALLSRIALVVLDIRARQQQKRNPVYDRMEEDTKALKLDTFDTAAGSSHDMPYEGEMGALHDHTLSSEDNFYTQRDARRNRGNSYDHNPDYSLASTEYLPHGRPPMYSRDNSQFQSSRSDVPLIQAQHTYGQSQSVAYQSARQWSPTRGT